MRLAPKMMFGAILAGGVLWGQIFPAVDNQVAGIEVTDLYQSGNRLKVTVQNVTSGPIRGISLVLGRHRVDQDWSSHAGGGLAPHATAILSISMAGLPPGGTRHSPAPPGPLHILALAVGPPHTSAPEPRVTEVPKAAAPAAPVVKAAPSVKRLQSPNASSPAAPITPAPTVEHPAMLAHPVPPAVAVPSAKPEVPSTAVEAPPAAVAPAVKQAESPAASEPRAAPLGSVTELPRSPAAPPNATPVEKAKKPAPSSDRPGTHEQGGKDELAKLISLVEVSEPDLAGAFPRQTLREMVAAVEKEQNEVAAKAAVTAYDNGLRDALQSFAYGIQVINDRRDLDDDALREQVRRFLRNQRQALAGR